MVTHTTDSRGRVQRGGRGRPDGPQSHGCRGQVVGLTDHRPRALMPTSRSPCLRRLWAHRTGSDRTATTLSSSHSVVSEAAGFRPTRSWKVDTGVRPMAAGRYELASQSDGLGFRGVLGRENTSLTEELTAELAGILSWSLDGLDRLTRQGSSLGRSPPPTPSWRYRISSPRLLRSYATAARSALVTRSRLRTISAIGACGARTTDISRGSVQTFGRDLRAVISTLKVTRPRTDDDSRGYELDVAYRRGIGTVQVPNRGTNDVRQITA